MAWEGVMLPGCRVTKSAGSAETVPACSPPLPPVLGLPPLSPAVVECSPRRVAGAKCILQGEETIPGDMGTCLG